MFMKKKYKNKLLISHTRARSTRRTRDFCFRDCIHTPAWYSTHRRRYPYKYMYRYAQVYRVYACIYICVYIIGSEYTYTDRIMINYNIVACAAFIVFNKYSCTVGRYRYRLQVRCRGDGREKRNRVRQRTTGEKIRVYIILSSRTQDAARVSY